MNRLFTILLTIFIFALIALVWKDFHETKGRDYIGWAEDHAEHSCDLGHLPHRHYYEPGERRAAMEDRMPSQHGDPIGANRINGDWYCRDEQGKLWLSFGECD